MSDERSTSGMEMNTDERVALAYARISITDENVPKVERQLADLHDLAHRRDLHIVGTYTDDGLSAAKAENRPDFDRMLADLPNFPGAVILATEEARFARNESEKIALMLACVSAGATWETVRDGAVDPATASGALMSGIRGAIDSFESRRKAERQKAANAHRRATGLPQPGQRPFGWRIVGAKPMRLESVPEEQALIRQGIDMILSGQRTWAVVKVWNESGIKTGRGNNWTTTSAQSVLKRWRNAGWTEHDGEPVAVGEWEAVCTKDEQARVRQILATPIREPGWRKPAGLCSGIATCYCGETLLVTGNSQSRSYRCSVIMTPGAKDGRHVSIKVDQLDALVARRVVDSYFWRPAASDAADREAINLAALHDELGRVRASQAKLLDAYMDDDVPMTKAVYVKKNASLVAREAELDAAIAQTARASAHAAMLTEARRVLFEGRTLPLSAAAEAKRELREVFAGLSLEDRRRLVAATVRVSVAPGRTLDRVTIEGDGLPADRPDL